MEETPAEKIGGWLAVISCAVPALLASGFMAKWNVLPFAAWVLVAAFGTALGAALATSKRGRGAIAGALGGAGFVLGTWAYVFVREAVTGNAAFFQVELLIGGGLGAIPGLLLYTRWAARPPSPQL